MEKLLESYELRLKLVLEELENENCKDQKKAQRIRIIFYRLFISDIKEEIECKKENEEVEKRKAKQAIVPCVTFWMGSCPCKDKCRSGNSKE